MSEPKNQVQRKVPRASLDQHGYITWPGYVSPSPSFPQTTGMTWPTVTWTSNVTPAQYMSASSLVSKT